jgi:hypothetical protein
MKRTAFFVPIAVLAVALLIVSIVAAQSGGGYDLSWSTIGGGGGLSSGGSYSLDGTIGQANAGTLTGGGYTLNSGFWGLFESLYKLFLPLLKR